MRYKIPNWRRWRLLAKAAWNRRRPLSKSALRTLMVLSPIFALLFAICKNPVLIQTSDASSGFSGAQLIRNCSSHSECSSYLGTFRTHRIYASLDDIRDPDYLSFAARNTHNGGNALAISIVDMGGGWGGNLLGHVLGKLAAVSPGDRERIINLLTQAKSSPHDVLSYGLRDIPTAKRRTFPVEHLLLLKLGEVGKKGYTGEIRELLDIARQEHTSNLILPCLGRNPGARGGEWLSCGDTYAALFVDLEPSASPRRVYLSLYKEWTDETIGRQAASLDAAWESALASERSKSGPLPIIYEPYLRPMLLFLFVCLLACSFRAELTVKAFVMVCGSFVPLSLGVLGGATKLLSGVLGSPLTWGIKIFLLLVLSVGYGFFAGMDVHEVLRTRDQKTLRGHN